MVRLLSFGIEAFSSIVFVIPAVFMFRLLISVKPSAPERRRLSGTAATMLFTLYLAAVFSVTGIPSVLSWHTHPDFNLIPLIDIMNNPPAYIRNTMLNILLFMPFGFLLPAIWKEYRCLRSTAVAGVLLSLLIEILQIFTFRLTDVDDLITNTAGTMLGYCIGRRFAFRLPFTSLEKETWKGSRFEPVILVGLVFLISFCLKPVLSDAIWGWVIESPMWEAVK